MTFARLAFRSLVHYRRTHAAVAFGVAAAVAVLAGSWLVGSSVRESLRSLATSRLGAASVAIAAAQPFPTSLAGRMASDLGVPVAPIITLTGTARHEASARRAGAVNIYGVDAQFFALHGVTAEAPARTEALVSADLAAELGVAAGDALVVRIARPTDIPLDSLFGGRDDAGRSIRLATRGTLTRDQMGDFNLGSSQGPARAVFVQLARLQRDLGIGDRINTLLVGGDAGADRARASLTRQATAEDFGLTVEPLPPLNNEAAAIIESKSGLIPDAMAAPVQAIAEREHSIVTPVLTWLATRLTAGDRSVPYSLVSAVGPDAGGDADLARWLASTGDQPPVVLNAWAASELQATTGASLELEFFRWADEGRLVTGRATFRVAGVVPMRGLALDRRLAPDYPGITTATDLTDWDPPFPIDLKLVRPADEKYWDDYRTAPKAFIPLAAGQALWRTRHGQITSLRVRPAKDSATAASSRADIAATLRAAVPAAIGLDRSGLSVVDVRRQNLEASAGATDFSAYFSYFSAFLMVSALLLSALFFRLSTEQRLPQIGVLRACGFASRDIRRLLIMEGLMVAAAGGLLGIALAIGWANAMMYALRTWWVGAVGTTRLVLHIDFVPLVFGAAAATLVSVLAIAWTVRTLGRATPRAQLAGLVSEPASAGAGVPAWLAPIALVLAASLAGLSFAKIIAPAGGFFGAGALMLIAGLAAFRSWIDQAGGGRTRQAKTIASLTALAIRNAAWRPGRSLTVSGLVAAAVFLLVAVDAFRKAPAAGGARDAGTGGFALLAESAVPLAHDLQTPEGRVAVGLTTGSGDNALTGVDIIGLRLRPGDDTSCLNLYQPKQPRIVGVPDRLMQQRRFTFAATVSGSVPGGNPWALLGPPDASGLVPAIVDATSLEYVLHASVGDVLVVDQDSSRPLHLRIVAALADSVLQGEILISEGAFAAVFPDLAGYRAFLVSVSPDTPERVNAVSGILEERLDAFGFDAEDTTRRLEAFHRVENTYLSAFQALGGLGLVLGCLGLVAIVLRNVLERRRELALLGAAGFTGRQLQTLVAIEHVALVGAGLIVGVAAAALAVAPVLVARGDGPPWRALVWVVPVAVIGFVAAFGATRRLRTLPLVPSLRSE